MKLHNRLLLLSVMMSGLAYAPAALAAACATAATGNWSTAATWAAPCNVAGGPGAGDTVTIGATHTVTLTANAAAASISITAATAANGITLNGKTLNVSGVVAMNGPSANNITSTFNVGSGTLTAASIDIAGGGGNRVALMSVSTGTITTTGSITFSGNAGNSQFTSTGASTVTVGGDFDSGGTLTTSGTGTIKFNGSVAQNIGKYTTYNNIAIANTAGGVSLLGTTSVGGTLTLSSGTFTVGSGITVTGTTSISGTLSITSASGAKTFAGLVTINAGGTWSNTANDSITFNNGLTHNGTTFSAGTGTHTFDTNNQAIGGTSAIDIPKVTVSGVTLTNNGTLTVSTTLSGSGTLANGTSPTTTATLNIGMSSPSISNLTASVTGNTVNYNRSSTQTVMSPTGSTYYNLTLSGTSAKTLPGALTISNNFTLSGTATTTAAGALAVGGSFTIGNGTTFAGSTFTHTLQGDFSNNGTFTANTSTISCTGSAAQAIGGTQATTFNNLTINKSSGNVTVTSASTALSPTVSGTLTLTSGKLITTIGTNQVGLGTAAIISGGSATSYVAGALQKNYSSASTLTFPVGDTNQYTPAVIQGTAGFTSGSLTISTTGTEHGSIGSSGIDSTKSVNRYWTLTASGLPASSTYNATFNFINGSPVDFDSGATTANFIVQRWNGSTWTTATLNGSCTATPGTNLCKQINGANAFGDFAIGEQASGVTGVGPFNAFETSTAAGSVTGQLYTKRVANAFNVAIVAVSNGAVNMSPSTNALTVEVINSSGTPGTFSTTTNCWSGWSQVQSQTVSAPVGWSSGRITVAINAPVQAVRNARIRVTQGASIGCSTDNFSIRPTAFTGLSSTDANNTGSTGTPFLKTGANFTLSVNSVAGYDGIPNIGTVVGSPNAGTIGGAFGAAAGNTGQATGNAFYYGEVGNFSVDVNGIFDSDFTSVDQSNDCITSSFSNTPDAAGKVGCNFGNTAASATFGRFTPDNFAVSFNTPQFVTACAAGAFTYVGQRFAYNTAPVITVTARNGTGNGLTNQTTTNYTGSSWWKITSASLTGKSYAAASGTLDATGVTSPDPTIVDNGDGTGTLTFNSGGSGFVFGRTTPSAPFDAEISLGINVLDSDGVAFAGNPAVFGAATAGNGIAFSGGKEMRFGRLKLSNAHGSELLNLPVPIATQYWKGSGFITNVEDSCTSISSANIALAKSPSNCTTSVSGSVGFALGKGSLTLPKTGAKCRADIAVDLSATAENKTYLQGAWSGTSYTNNPAARATFGVYKSGPVIYIRENY